jgi:hypothetical protein
LPPHSHAQRQRRDEKDEWLAHSIEIKNRAFSERDDDQTSCREGIFDQGWNSVSKDFNCS